MRSARRWAISRAAGMPSCWMRCLLSGLRRTSATTVSSKSAPTGTPKAAANAGIRVTLGLVPCSQLRYVNSAQPAALATVFWVVPACCRAVLMRVARVMGGDFTTVGLTTGVVVS